MNSIEVMEIHKKNKIKQIKKITQKISISLFILLSILSIFFCSADLIIGYFSYYVPVLFFLKPLEDAYINKNSNLKVIVVVTTMVISIILIITRLADKGNIYDNSFKIFLVYPIVVGSLGICGLVNGKVYSNFNWKNRKSELYAYNISNICIGGLMYFMIDLAF